MSKRREDPYQERSGLRSILIWSIRLLLLFVTVFGCVTASLFLYSNLQQARQGGRIQIEGGDPSLSDAESVALQLYLSSNVEALNAPAGSSTTPVTFVIAPGETANQIAANLASQQLLTDQTLFLRYLRFYGLDAQLEAGSFELDQTYTIPELAGTLTKSIAQDITLRFLEGWRHEEMVAYLNAVTPANIVASEFQAFVRREKPFDLTPYPFLAELPPEQSLEGFLFPDTYLVPLDADAAYLLNLMLSTFGNRVTPATLEGYAANGLSVSEAVTMASIIERETPLAEERPIMAGVFYNRLAQAIPLQADPTVQYVVGYQAANDSWWKSPLFQVDLELDSAYNTYLYPGLPPGPIANPSLTALAAVGDPVANDFIFFVADCSGNNPGGHHFSVTYDQHLARVEACR